MKLTLAIAVTTVSIWTSSAVAATVTDPNTGRIWRQLTDTELTTGLNWNQIASACDPSTGACTGTVGGVDYTGWTWATVADVNALFTDFGIPQFTTATPSQFSQANSSWAPAFVNANAFSPTFVLTSERSVYGWTRSTASATNAYWAAVVDSLTGSADRANSNFSVAKNNGVTDIGAWLYQDPTAVPEPSTYLLLLAGLGLLGCMVRRSAAI